MLRGGWGDGTTGKRGACLMLKALTIVYREGLAEGTYYSAVIKFLAALRIMFFPEHDNSIPLH